MIAELQTAISKVPSRKARLQGLTQVEAVKIKVERAALLFRGAPTAVIASSANALIMLAVAWNVVEHRILFTWVGVVLAIALVRAGLWLRYRMGGVGARHLSNFAKLHVFFMALNGMAWGALAPTFARFGANSGVSGSLFLVPKALDLYAFEQLCGFFLNQRGIATTFYIEANHRLGVAGAQIEAPIWVFHA